MAWMFMIGGALVNFQPRPTQQQKFLMRVSEGRLGMLFHRLRRKYKIPSDATVPKPGAMETVEMAQLTSHRPAKLLGFSLFPA
jgi:hypothetical protein